MIVLVMLPCLVGGLVLGAFISWPLAFRAGVRSVERDAEEVARILDGVVTPTVRPAVIPSGWVQWAREQQVWTTPALPLTAAPLAAHGSQRVASTPADYRPKHALVLAHLQADTLIGRPPRELVSAS